jgi:WD40 repeat protein
VFDVDFSPDGKLLATASSAYNGDGAVHLWNVASGKPLGEPFYGHTDSVSDVEFSPDGKLLASASEDKTVHLWNVASGEQREEPLTGHTDVVNDVDFSPDGKLLASASADETVRLWDVEPRQPLGESLTHTSWVSDAAFSPDSKLLASAGYKTVRLWDVATGKEHGESLTGHTGEVTAVDFSPDGELLASGGGDKTVRLWDVASGKQHGEPFEGHTDMVEDVAFSPDGKLLASASYDGVRLWDIEVESLVSEACRIANRNLSKDEWSSFVGAEVTYGRTCPNLQAGPSLPAGYGAEGLSGSLSRGVHVADVFDPAFQFEVGKGWEAWESTDFVDMETEPKGSLLSFTNPLYYVLDPSNLSEAKEVPAPENAGEWVSWFQNHPNLETSKPLPVSVGGASGMQIDVTASSTPENYPRMVCGQPCVPLYWTSEPMIASYERYKERFVIVEVGGETVIIYVAAPAEKFDAFAPKAQEILDSVEWKGG